MAGSTSPPSGPDWRKEVSTWKAPDAKRDKFYKDFAGHRLQVTATVDQVLDDPHSVGLKDLNDLRAIGTPKSWDVNPAEKTFKQGKGWTLHEILSDYFKQIGVTDAQVLNKEVALSLYYLTQQKDKIKNIDDLKAGSKVTIEAGMLFVHDKNGNTVGSGAHLRKPSAGAGAVLRSGGGKPPPAADDALSSGGGKPPPAADDALKSGGGAVSPGSGDALRSGGGKASPGTVEKPADKVEKPADKIENFKKATDDYVANPTDANIGGFIKAYQDSDYPNNPSPVLTILNDAQSKLPNDPNISYLIGSVYYNTEQNPEALAAYKLFVEKINAAGGGNANFQIIANERIQELEKKLAPPLSTGGGAAPPETDALNSGGGKAPPGPDAPVAAVPGTAEKSDVEDLPPLVDFNKWNNLVAEYKRQFKPKGVSLDAGLYAVIIQNFADKNDGVEDDASLATRQKFREAAQAMITRRGSELNPVVKARLLNDMAASYMRYNYGGNYDKPLSDATISTHASDYNGEKALALATQARKILETPGIKDQMPTEFTTDVLKTKEVDISAVSVDVMHLYSIYQQAHAMSMTPSAPKETTIACYQEGLDLYYKGLDATADEQKWNYLVRMNNIFDNLAVELARYAYYKGDVETVKNLVRRLEKDAHSWKSETYIALVELSIDAAAKGDISTARELIPSDSNRSGEKTINNLEWKNKLTPDERREKLKSFFELDLDDKVQCDKILKRFSEKHPAEFAALLDGSKSPFDYDSSYWMQLEGNLNYTDDPKWALALYEYAGDPMATDADGKPLHKHLKEDVIAAVTKDFVDNETQWYDGMERGKKIEFPTEGDLVEIDPEYVWFDLKNMVAVEKYIRAEYKFGIDLSSVRSNFQLVERGQMYKFRWGHAGTLLLTNDAGKEFSAINGEGHLFYVNFADKGTLSHTPPADAMVSAAYPLLRKGQHMFDRGSDEYSIQGSDGKVAFAFRLFFNYPSPRVRVFTYDASGNINSYATYFIDQEEPMKNFEGAIKALADSTP